MLGRARSFLSNPLKEAAKGGFEVEVKGEEGRSFFPMMVSYYGHFSERKNMSAALHGAGGRQSCVRCHSLYEKKLKSRESSYRVVAERIDAIVKTVEKQAEAASVDGRARSTRRQGIQSEIPALLSQQSLPEWPPFLKDM